MRFDSIIDLPHKGSGKGVRRKPQAPLDRAVPRKTDTRTQNKINNKRKCTRLPIEK